jgi:hypothetical protein
MKPNKIEGPPNFVPAFCENKKHGLVTLTQEQYDQGPEGWLCPISGCGRKVVPQSQPGPTFRSK